jgi:DNA-directed RNA polymerase subunit RPC12/RpoP
MAKVEINFNFVCARCQKALEGIQVYDTIVKVQPCPCLVKDLKKEQEDEWGRKYLPEDLG